MAQEYRCDSCPIRARHDRNPKSFIGRFWRWHINICPGFRAYFTQQDEDTQAAIREKYHFEKYRK